MNLIEREITESSLMKFREFQFDMHEEFIKVGLKYLINLGLNYDPMVYDFEACPFVRSEDLTYSEIHNYAVNTLKVQLFDDNHIFLNLNIPRILNRSFFRLNSVNYVPVFYISDEPIIRKEKSILLTSTFHPITLYFKDNRVIFMGSNILISDFFQAITYDWDDQSKQIIEKHFKIDLNEKSITDVIDIISTKIYSAPTLRDIKYRIEEVFFDDWTSELYRVFYNIEPTFDNVLKIALNKWIYEPKRSFIDLRYKRLTFIEPILKPFFRAVTRASMRLINGTQPRDLKLSLDAFVKGFFEDLDGNVLYDTVNGFSSVLAHKASFKNPFGTGRLPKEVSSIHATHKGRICTNSITNSDPGQTVNLIPDQNIDLRYGIFKFTNDELASYNEIDDNNTK